MKRTWTDWFGMLHHYYSWIMRCSFRCIRCKLATEKKRRIEYADLLNAAPMFKVYAMFINWDIHRHEHQHEHNEDDGTLPISFMLSAFFEKKEENVSSTASMISPHSAIRRMVTRSHKQLTQCEPNVYLRKEIVSEILPLFALGQKISLFPFELRAEKVITYENISNELSYVMFFLYVHDIRLKLSAQEQIELSNAVAEYLNEYL